MLRNVPVIIILGCTGSGKTKLSLDLCRKFRGSEIISADSMQVRKRIKNEIKNITSVAHK